MSLPLVRFLGGRRMHLLGRNLAYCPQLVLTACGVERPAADVQTFDVSSNARIDCLRCRAVLFCERSR